MRVVVVGAGVVGLCAAWSLRQDGHEVVVVERGDFDGDKCSLGNSGIVVPSHFVPLAAPGMVAAGLKMLANRDGPFRIKPSLDKDLARWCWLFTRHCTEENVRRAAPVLLEMHLRSRAMFEEFAERWDNEFGLERRGMAVVCHTEAALHEEAEVARLARTMGLKADVLDRAGIDALRTGTRIEAVGAVHFADDAHMAPHVFVRRLQDELAATGATIRWNTPTTSLLPDGRGVVTPTGEIEGEATVVATGTWSGILAKGIGLDMPLQPGKGLNVGLTDPRVRLEVPMILKEARIAVTPMCGGIRFGGTMELGEWDLKPDAVRARAMVKNIPVSLPDFEAGDFDGVPVWTGLRPCSPDGLPYVGRTTKSPNVIFATGHGMMGLSLGPVTGRMVASELSSPGSTPHSLSPDRFDG